MEISWIPTTTLPTSGNLGLCCSPGSLSHNRDEDLKELKKQNVDHIFCLQEPEEMLKMVPQETIDERREAVLDAQMGFTHEPIIDCSAPSLEQAQKIVSLVKDELESGNNVVLHCWGGRGRAGTIAACTLVAYGIPSREAITAVRTVRPGAIEVDEQVALVNSFTV